MPNILVLGGTGEARALCDRLTERGTPYVVSLAGGTDAHYPGKVRVGGFGGVEGIKHAIAADGYSVIVDATHPFAQVISVNARAAARAMGIRYFRLERRPWRRASADRWVDVRSMDEAAERIASGSVVFLAVGVGGLAPFLPRLDLKLVIRAIAPPDVGDHPDVTVVSDRGPFVVDDERDLWDRFEFDSLVTKNSGGEATAAKLLVARERRTLVYMVRRPEGQPRPNAENVDQMMAKLRRYT
ncbi:MAG: precorrin-6A/cobalt-precorrin-6A reductase [Pseudomonadota bacterium]